MTLDKDKTYNNNPLNVVEDDEDEILFLEDDDLIILAEDEGITVEDASNHSVLIEGKKEPWKMMIVDDEPTVHQATELALKNFVFEGTPLDLIHAYSGSQAQKLIPAHSDLALILLDVVMESNDAGLKVVHYIRDDLKNKQVQIILRTGQPGEAPEESVIRKYEINDYKLKVELTRQRLIATTIAALRAYRNVLAVEEKTRDLTQTLKTLQEMQLQLVQSEKMSALGNLVAGVAHEINNPTSFLQGNIQPAINYVRSLLSLIELCQNKLPEQDEEIEAKIEKIDLEFIREDLPKLLESMHIGVERIRNISNSLRTFSRKDQEHKTGFNIHEGIDSTLLILTHRTKANQQRPAIKIIKEYADIPEVQCFPGQLNQVFMNLLANAIDAFDEANKGKTYAEIKANQNTITIHTSMVDMRVIIQIKDNGCGMKPETKGRIFEQGFTTKAVGKGTGLGMAIAHQIVTEKHGGTITCDSTPGEGTTFTIKLPLG
ncbi:MAG: ATP-binding protein [Hormoscilla sp.]